MINVPRVPLSALAERYEAQIDLFICAVSFEERSICVAKALNPAGVDNVLVCNNKGLRDKVTSFRKSVMERFASNAVEVCTELNDPLYTADTLLRAIRSVTSKHHVKICVIDITAFTHESLLILLKVIYIELGGADCQVSFVYTAASDYSLNETKEEDKWLARGVGTVRSILGYSGFPDPSKKTHLVILTGFESERSQKLIDIYEPAKVSLGIGRLQTSVSKDHHRVNELNYSQLPVSREQVNAFSFSCTNPVQVKKDLGHLIDFESSDDYNVIIAAFNTKLSTIGVGLFAMDNPQVQLCYATATSYNIKHYSSPADFCYVYTKNFENVKRHKL
jgi:hypothetical protein